MYAFIVKNDEGTWDVWRTMPTIPIQDREERLQSALASGLPITGMVLTQYQGTATSGAVWDGENFNGVGNVHPFERAGGTDWSTVTQYGYICNNVLLLIMLGQAGTTQDEQFQAVFDGETTIISIPENQNVQVGDIWDGSQIVSQGS